MLKTVTCRKARYICTCACFYTWCVFCTHISIKIKCFQIGEFFTHLVLNGLSSTFLLTHGEFIFFCYYLRVHRLPRRDEIVYDFDVTDYHSRLNCISVSFLGLIALWWNFLETFWKYQMVFRDELWGFNDVFLWKESKGARKIRYVWWSDVCKSMSEEQVVKEKLVWEI